MKRQVSKNMGSIKRGDGFTLIELLVVIGIIGTLVALLIPAMALVKRRARVIEAKKDVNQIEAALNEYHATYRRWPSLVGAAIGDSPPIKIAGEVAELLISGTYDGVDNTRRFTFLDFKHFNASGSPISPWGDEELEDTEEEIEHFYWAIFDLNYNNELIGCCPCGFFLCPISNNVNRGVIVWTANTDLTPTDDAYIIGSWKE
jgi:prepilin-type N-terminal cleavage/methylation domain-containing protein